MQFKDLVSPFGLVFDGDAEIAGICADSRSVKPGDLFVCMPSGSRDTHSYLGEVKERGAAAAIVHSAEPFDWDLGLPLAYLDAEGSRFNFVVGHLCREVLGDPTSSMRVVGITGTNGKTTTAWILRQAVANWGDRAAYLGTLGYHDGESLVEGSNTTPFPVELWLTLADARDKGVDTFVMEVSSHALAERRVAGMSFDVGVFLNLTQDHLDFHGSMENYAHAKKLLFTEWAASSKKRFVGVLNGDDPVAQEWMRDLPCEVWTFGGSNPILGVDVRSLGVDRMEVEFGFGDEKELVHVPLGGGFNVQNVTACAVSILAMGEGLCEVAEGLKDVRPAPGRFEPVVNETGVAVIVDYAHTPDALEKLLGSVREFSAGRVICVFGCGGDRDRSKRPKMAEVASRLSDLVLVTSDNPRTEDPQAIIDDVLVGVTGESLVEIDRRSAIFEAVAMASVGDVVVIAGKGHEDYQIVGRRKEPFDDRLVAQSALEGRL
jgi:UDP-N-acetylmuramoyl-L-alanyl-D-glutamate--2,6-diaminopimelate ligase